MDGMRAIASLKPPVDAFAPTPNFVGCGGGGGAFGGGGALKLGGFVVGMDLAGTAVGVV